MVKHKDPVLNLLMNYLISPWESQFPGFILRPQDLSQKLKVTKEVLLALEATKEAVNRSSLYV